MLIKWLTLMLASLSVSTVAIFFAYQNIIKAESHRLLSGG
jgi:hypothetical protein